MPQLQKEPPYVGDWLKAEVMPEHAYCRDNVVLASTGTEYTIKSGTPLGKITTGGKFTAQDPDKSDGSQNVAGIMYFTTVVPATGDKLAAALVRGPAVVGKQALNWSADSNLNMAAAITALEALGIQVREAL